MSNIDERNIFTVPFFKKSLIYEVCTYSRFSLSSSQTFMLPYVLRQMSESWLPNTDEILTVVVLFLYLIVIW